jgi:hypothetical protein
MRLSLKSATRRHTQSGLYAAPLGGGGAYTAARQRVSHTLCGSMAYEWAMVSIWRPASRLGERPREERKVVPPAKRVARKEQTLQEPKPPLGEAIQSNDRPAITDGTNQWRRKPARWYTKTAEWRIITVKRRGKNLWVAEKNRWAAAYPKRALRRAFNPKRVAGNIKPWNSLGKHWSAAVHGGAKTFLWEIKGFMKSNAQLNILLSK